MSLHLQNIISIPLKLYTPEILAFNTWLVSNSHNTTIIGATNFLYYVCTYVSFYSSWKPGSYQSPMHLIKLALIKQHQMKKKVFFLFAIAQPYANKSLYLLIILLQVNFLNHHQFNNNVILISLVYKLSYDYNMANLKREKIMKVAKIAP